MIASGKTKKTRRKTNDPARFIGTAAISKEGEDAKIYHYLDESKVEEEAKYDGLYAICTDLLDDEATI